MLELNRTFFYQLINFWLIIAVLYFLLFKPLLQRLRARRAEIDGKLQEAERRDQSVHAAAREYQQTLQAARRDGSELLSGALRDATEMQRQRLEQAREQAAAQLTQARASIATEKEIVQQQLGAEAQRLSVPIAEKFLGRRLA
ncbi:MAG: F0F1 ATP synthase subunit B [Candidatus Tectomicrobia bacterium]|nr:F0F1 ATP synthase subunit B [Candidatus Tectomicrobia bacterium]